MKYLHLVWAALFRRKLRTILTLLACIVLLAAWMALTHSGQQAWSVARVGIATLPQRPGAAVVVVVGPFVCFVGSQHCACPEAARYGSSLSLVIQMLPVNSPILSTSLSGATAISIRA
jgi:hypothetical protein